MPLEDLGRLAAGLFAAGASVVCLLEPVAERRPLRMPVVRRWLTNTGLAGISYGVERVALPLSALGVAALAEERSLGLLAALDGAPILQLALGALLLDLAHYLAHRLLHAVPWLWRFHEAHHTDLDVDFTTAVRHHPLEGLMIAPVLGVAVLALGIGPTAVLLHSAMRAGWDFVTHGNLRFPAWLETPLRSLLVTPDMHRIHHSAVRAESNSNFGGLLSGWDRLLGTYRSRPAAGPIEMTLGVAGRTEADLGLWALLVAPFRMRSSTRDAALVVRG